MKRVPSALEFDAKDPIHLELIQSAANIYATLFGLNMEKDSQKVAEIASKVHFTPFVPKGNVKIETDEKKKEEAPVMINEEE